MKEKLGCVAIIIFLVMGFVQVLATIKGIQIWFDVPWMLAAFVSLFIGYIPFLGTVAGIMGATAGWGWALWPAIAFFCWPYIIFFAALAVGGVADAVDTEEERML